MSPSLPCRDAIRIASAESSNVRSTRDDNNSAQGHSGALPGAQQLKRCASSREGQPDVIAGCIGVYPRLRQRRCSPSHIIRHAALIEDERRTNAPVGMVDEAAATVPKGAIVRSVSESRLRVLAGWHGARILKRNGEDGVAAARAEFALDVPRVRPEAWCAASHATKKFCTPTA